MGNYPALIAICVCTSIVYLSSDAYAAAWTQGKGIGQMILSLGGYQSSHYFDQNGVIQDSRNTFTKYEINPFFEYGLTDDITIGANPLIQHWQSEKPNTSLQNNHSGDCDATGNTSGEIIESEFLVRKKLLERGNTVLSIQPLFKTPCIRINDASISTIWNSYDLELRLLGGYGFKWESDGRMRPFAGQYHFVNLETAYRKRNGQFSDQIKIDGTAGFRYSEDILILGQFFSIISTGEENVGSIEVQKGIYSANIDNYSNLKLQLSGVMQIAKASSFQLGVYADVMGKNYGQGSGVMASLWKGF